MQYDLWLVIVVTAVIKLLPILLLRLLSLFIEVAIRTIDYLLSMVSPCYTFLKLISALIEIWSGRVRQLLETGGVSSSLCQQGMMVIFIGFIAADKDLRYGGSEHELIWAVSIGYVILQELVGGVLWGVGLCNLMFHIL